MTINDKQTLLVHLDKLKETVLRIDIDNFKQLPTEDSPVLTFGDRLRTIRCIKELTQKELAVKSGISTSLIGYYEGNKGVPAITNLEWLCKALDVTATDLLGF